MDGDSFRLEKEKAMAGIAFADRVGALKLLHAVGYDSYEAAAAISVFDRNDDVAGKMLAQTLVTVEKSVIYRAGLLSSSFEVGVDLIRFFLFAPRQAGDFFVALFLSLMQTRFQLFYFLEDFFLTFE